MNAFVLIHGGSMNARYWDRLIPHLEAPSLAVDLPGRGAHPADLNEVRIRDNVAAVVSEIEAARFEKIVLVGNSLAGITMPGVAARLPERVAHLVYSSCMVPGEGQRVADLLPEGVREVVLGLEQAVTTGTMRLEATPAAADEILDTDTLVGVDAPTEARSFCEAPANRQFPEVLNVLFERMDWRGFPWSTPRTYVKNLRDAILLPELQDVMIENMRGARVIELDAPHCPAVACPEKLAPILNEIAAGL